MTKIVFGDVETTGTLPDRHHIWELALIVRDIKADPATTADTWTDTEYCWQIRPDLSTADPMALKIGRYYSRTVFEGLSVGDTIRVKHPDHSGEAPTADELAQEVAWLLDGATLAAANVAFDAAFLDRFLRANGQAPAWDYHLLEMESYAAGAFGLEPKWKLDQLLGLAGVTVAPEDRHSALGDARAIRDLYDAVRAMRNGGTT